jgi:hypothetical protein
MVRTSITTIGLIAVFSIVEVFAQDTAKTPATTESSSQDETLMKLKGKVDGLDEPLAALNSTVDKLNKIQVSGYIQFQYRSAVGYKGAIATDSTSSGNYGKYNFAVGDFAGGKFSDRVSDLFQIRRARVKLGYATALTQSALTLDGTPWSFAPALTGVTVNTTAGGDTVKGTTSTSANFLSSAGVQVKEASFRFTEPWL